MDAKQPLRTADAVQKRHPIPAVALATFKKFSEDQSTNLAAMIAFWAIFSIFPLFLVFVTLLGWFLPAGQKTDVLKHVAALFPLLDVQTVKGLSGQAWPLILGLITAFWSGSGVVRSVQTAFNSVWEIPMHQRPGLLEQVKRSLFALTTIGLGLVIATVISGFITGQNQGVELHWYSRLGGYIVAILLDVGLFVAAFRMLTDRDVSTRDVLPGAILSGLAFFVLQQISSLIISHYLQKAQGTYGNFATVITVLWWFYLQAQITLLGAQLNVVLKERLHPRSLVDAPQTEADHRVLEAYAEERTYQPEEEVDTRIRSQGQAEEQPQQR